ncbi:MAG: RIP metalloprotease RseP [Patescibacteria group bacterium]
MLLTIALFLVILGLTIFVHEFGHFSAAKKMKMGVEEFGFGFPPRIVGIQRLNQPLSGNSTSKRSAWRIIKGRKTPEDEHRSTIYSLNWIPIGGFVKIKGEQGDQPNAQDSFSSKKIWKRAVVLSAGVGMNFILAYVIISIGFWIGIPSILDSSLSGSATVSNERLQVLEVSANSPAEAAGIEMGDTIVSLDGKSFSTTDQLSAYTAEHLGEEITVIVSRSGEEITYSIAPADLEGKGIGQIGIGSIEVGNVSYPWYAAIWMGAKTTVSITVQIIIAFYEIIKNLVITQQAGVDIAGPVGIAVMTGQVAKLGFIYILQFIALLSINLGIINFLPFPALDGGRVLFLAIEKLRGKAMNQKTEAAIHNIGFLILIFIVLLVTFKDILRLF